MATIVKHIKTQNYYALLGTGFGAFHSQKPNWFFGDLVADESSGQYAMVCVANSKGKIGWFESDELEVVRIDGKEISSIFSSNEYEA